MRRLIVIAAVVIAYACGSDNPATKDAGHDSKTADAPHDAGMDAHFDAPPLGSGTMFTVHNYLGWCSVQIGSGSATAASGLVDYVAPGTYQLTARPGSGYALGSDMWHHTNGDTGSGSGSGEPGTQTGSAGSGSGSSTLQSVAAATVGTTAKCVWVCCPPTAGTGCPTTDQCP